MYAEKDVDKMTSFYIEILIIFVKIRINESSTV